MSNALTISMPLPSASSLDAYIQATNRFPILSQEEEQRLARRFREHNDLEAARTLVLSHLRLVVAIARNYLGYGLPHADLIQEGNIGLMKAVKRFDPDRGVRLVSFAVHWIRAEIHEFILRNWRMVKVATTKAQRKLFFNLRSLKSGFHTLSPEEVDAVAKQLNVKAQDVVEMETRMSGQDIALDPMTEEEDDGFAPIAYLSNAEDEPGRILEHEEDERVRSQGLERALEALDPRSRRIIEARWLREKDPATLHELASEFGVSAERIRQIEAQSMKKMRALMAPAQA
ncbi:MAG TPA: RNA polymerase sigma factor RpoH [Burkholderiales bacterium]|jgi:RNA polymerase sigma-32 factor|nr:RNA polymerase sigma factor RpoH [Burkholderiales bacterium]